MSQVLQLDQTHIAIRERSFVEILDLALPVLRRHSRPLCVLLAMGIAPAFALNTWVIGPWLVDLEFIDNPTQSIAQTITALVVIVACQASLVTAPATLYLGHAVFQAEPRLRDIIRPLLGSAIQLVVLQVIVRLMLFGTLLLIFWPYTVWPYLNEVILLERNPLFRWRSRGPNTLKRSWALHNFFFGDLFARWLFSAVLAFILTSSLWATILMIRWALTGSLQFLDASIYTIDLQLALWLVVGYFTVVRFLAYLDLRIRLEGWEVEIRLRSERARLIEEFAAQ